MNAIHIRKHMLPGRFGAGSFSGSFDFNEPVGPPRLWKHVHSGRPAAGSLFSAQTMLVPDVSESACVHRLASFAGSLDPQEPEKEPAAILRGRQCFHMRIASAGSLAP